jgi:hypothetical protein
VQRLGRSFEFLYLHRQEFIRVVLDGFRLGEKSLDVNDVVIGI